LKNLVEISLEVVHQVSVIIYPKLLIINE
jgi:hypothetical protein